MATIPPPQPPQAPAQQAADLFLPAHNPLTMEMVPRHLKMHSLSEHELDAIASGSSSIHLSFFGVCVGAFISFMIVIYSGGVTDPSKRSMYGMLAFSTAIMATYFGIRGIADNLKSKALVRELKAGKSKKD
jgi:hypothetical protein